MKRRDLISRQIKEGCVLHREGAKHSVFLNPENEHMATIPPTPGDRNCLGKKNMPATGYLFPQVRSLAAGKPHPLCPPLESGFANGYASSHLVHAVRTASQCKVGSGEPGIFQKPIIPRRAA